MKKILVLLMITVMVILIYFAYQDKRVYYLSLGDGLSIPIGSENGYGDYLYAYLKQETKLEQYNHSFSDSSDRSIDLLQKIEDNIKKEGTIRNALIKADVVTISIGTNDLLAYVASGTDDFYVYIDEVMEDMDRLLKEIRSSCKEKIFVLSYYNYYNEKSWDPFIQYANKRLETLCKKYNLSYIDITGVKNYLTNSSIYPNEDGHFYIYSKIKNKIVEKKIL